MPSIVKDLLLSKKFVVALLTAIVAGAAHFGFNVDLTSILTVATPFMVYIGAQGWADSGKEKSKVEGATAIELQKMSEVTAMRLKGWVPQPDSAKPDSIPGALPGFTRIQLTVVLSVFAAAILCGGIVSACANPKHSAVRFGQCVLEEGVLGEVLGALEDPNYLRLIKEIAVKHTVGLVECALVAVASQPAPQPADVAAGVSARTSPDIRTARAREALEEIRKK